MWESLHSRTETKVYFLRYYGCSGSFKYNSKKIIGKKCVRATAVRWSKKNKWHLEYAHKKKQRVCRRQKGCDSCWFSACANKIPILALVCERWWKQYLHVSSLIENMFHHAMFSSFTNLWNMFSFFPQSSPPSSLCQGARGSATFSLMFPEAVIVVYFR